MRDGKRDPLILYLHIKITKNTKKEVEVTELKKYFMEQLSEKIAYDFK